jgi:hypothetical protein
VLMLRPRGKDYVEDSTFFHMKNVLLPLDGSKYSESLLETAITLGGLGSVYTLLQVLPPAPAVAFGDGIPLPLERPDSAVAQAAAIEHLEEIADSFRKRGYTRLIRHWKFIRMSLMRFVTMHVEMESISSQW